MKQAVEKVIFGRKARIRRAYKRVRRQLRQHNLNNGTKYKSPTYESLRKRVKKKAPFELLTAEKGERVVKIEFRRMGKKMLSFYVFERVEIDHTVVERFVVHEKHCKSLGRPWLTQLVDCYSKVVIGFYLGFEPPCN
ncbi:hypothetical protein [Vibrio alginolyticus]|uniref:hypothetical protein n=1 Tax=Vibrio alginolyticus TaxID=663 RepID=UPI003D7C67B6